MQSGGAPHFANADAVQRPVQGVQRIKQGLGFSFAAIAPQAFEVGSEVRDVFIEDMPHAETAFVPSVNPGRFMADIYELARLRLARCGITAVYGGGFCTVTDPRFFSYRRSPRTGRFASLVWIERPSS